MKAEELRVGNLINVGALYSTYGIGTVCEILADSVVVKINESYHSYLFDDLQGVEFSEEWLVKFSFELHYGRYFKGNFCYYPDLKMFEWRGLPLLDSLWNEVHKLQNLHFALTGQELTIK
jgi:hypothetical protein